MYIFTIFCTNDTGTTTALGLMSMVPNAPMMTTFALSCWVGNSCVQVQYSLCVCFIYIDFRVVHRFLSVLL